MVERTRLEAIICLQPRFCPVNINGYKMCSLIVKNGDWSIQEFKKKPISKIVRIGILTLAIIAVAIVGTRWYIQPRTTVTTDNAKVSADLVSISAEVAGKLTDVYVQEGDGVKVGQLLAKVDDSQYLINL